MKTYKNLLVLLIVMSLMGAALTYAKQTDVRKEIERLRSSDPVERTAAARILGNIGDRRAVGPLISVLKDEHPQVRMNAVTALRWIGDPRAAEPLIAVLKDEDEGVQRDAAWALSKIAGKDFDKNFIEWQEWWEKNRETFPEAK